MLKRSFIFNVILAVILVTGLLFLFFNSLDWLTNHGQQTTVPSIVGKNMNAAIKSLEKQGFKIKVDSTFVSYKNPLEVLFQEPQEGTPVKIGRIIFLTVNKKSPPMIDMPNFVSLSFRNAMLVMQSYRLVMGDTLYKPDVAAGSVLEQRHNGKIITAGTKIPFGSKIDLVIGEGLYGEVEVPNLIGMSWKETKNLLNSLQLSTNEMWEGTIDDSATALVYMQQPEYLNELDFKNKIPKGDMIDIHIMQNPSQELLNKNQSGSKKLIGNTDHSIDIEEKPLNNVEAVNTIDTTPHKRKVPGLNVPSNEVKKSDEKAVGSVKINDKNIIKKASSTKKQASKAQDAEPIKKSEDNIKNEFD